MNSNIEREDNNCDDCDDTGDWDEIATISSEIPVTKDLSAQLEKDRGSFSTAAPVSGGLRPRDFRAYELEISISVGDRFTAWPANVFQGAKHSYISRGLSSRLGLRPIPLNPSSRIGPIISLFPGSFWVGSFVSVRIRLPSMKGIVLRLNARVIDMMEEQTEYFVLGFSTFQKHLRGNLSDLHLLETKRATETIAICGVVASQWIDEGWRISPSKNSVPSWGIDDSCVPYLTPDIDRLVLNTESSEPHEPRMKKENLLSLLSELDHCTPTNWELDETVAISWCDRTKLALEGLSGCCWEWWPLRRPFQPLRPGDIRLVWTCVSFVIPRQ